MKDVRQLSNFDPKSEPFKAALRDLRRIIRDEIEKLLTRVFYSPEFSALYRDYTGKLDFKAFQQKLLQGLEAERAKVERADESSLPFVFRVMSEIVSETESPELHQFNSQQENKDVFGQVYHLIGYPDYSPPTEWKNLFTHLACLFASWDLHSRNPSLHEDFSPFSDMILLLSFAKLMGAAYELFANYTMKGERELTRTKKSTKAKKEKSNKRKEFVIAIYEHGERIASGTRLSEAIKMLQRQFMKSKESELKKSKKERPKWGVIPDDMKTPGRDSIIELFKADGILESDFEEKRGHWFKKM
jgi:hypothetical protein